MTGAEDFVEGVRALTADAPYRVERTERGFTLSADVSDQRWRGFAGSRRQLTTVVHQVGLREDERVFRILDVTTTVRERQGVFAHTQSLSGFRGQSWSRRSTTVFRADQQARGQGRAVAYRFSTGEGLEMIRQVGRQLGWQEKWPATVVGALVVAIVGVLGAVAAVVVNLVLAFT